MDNIWQNLTSIHNKHSNLSIEGSFLNLVKNIYKNLQLEQTNKEVMWFRKQWAEPTWLIQGSPRTTVESRASEDWFRGTENSKSEILKEKDKVNDLSPFLRIWKINYGTVQALQENKGHYKTPWKKSYKKGNRSMVYYFSVVHVRMSKPIENFMKVWAKVSTCPEASS